jgi:hypothetical protein
VPPAIGGEQTRISLSPAAVGRSMKFMRGSIIGAAVRGENCPPEAAHYAYYGRRPCRATARMGSRSVMV